MSVIDTSEFERVTLGRKLGEGSFGSVFTGLLPSGRFVAVKVLEIEDDAPPLNKEVEIHRMLVHPNIIRYLHSRIDTDSTPKKLYVYLEFVTGGSIPSLMRTLPGNHLPYEAARVYARHMFLGLHYLHSHQVAHRDVKGDNLLISMDTGIAKLADFDQAKIMLSYSTLKSAATNTLAGTPDWMAPEVITEEQGYDPFKADIWSAGCTVAEMLTGHRPWTGGGNIMQVMQRIVCSEGWPDAIPKDAEKLGSEEVYDFLDKCFKRNARERPTSEQLLKHPYLDFKVPSELEHSSSGEKRIKRRVKCSSKTHESTITTTDE